MAIQPVEQGSAFAFRNVINNNFYELKVLSGASKPTESTAAVVGQMYLDTSEGKMYFCSNVSGSTYTWKPFASDMSASNVSYNNGSSGMSSDNVQDAIDELFTSASNGKELIADAITGMGVSTSANDTYATMAGNIEKIETGIDISDATLTAASELKKDIVAYSKDGQRIVGSLGQGTVNTPNISVNSAGKITASTSYTSGIIGSSTKSNTYQLSTQSGTTITPGTYKKTAVATGKYTTGPVYVAGDANLDPSNIRSGASIFGVSGRYTGDIKFSKCTVLHNGTQLRIDEPNFGSFAGCDFFIFWSGVYINNDDFSDSKSMIVSISGNTYPPITGGGVGSNGDQLEDNIQHVESGGDPVDAGYFWGVTLQEPKTPSELYLFGGADIADFILIYKSLVDSSGYTYINLYTDYNDEERFAIGEDYYILKVPR